MVKVQMGKEGLRRMSILMRRRNIMNMRRNMRIMEENGEKCDDEECETKYEAKEEEMISPGQTC